MSELRLMFVLSPWQNAFFHEVADVLCDELRAGGVDATTVTEPDRIEPDGDTVFVLLPPHEFLELEGHAWLHEPHLMARTVALSAEQPRQHFFIRNAELAGRAGAVLDFSAHAVAAYSALGVKARHLRFGYAKAWDRFREAVNPGPPELLFLGSASVRRLEQLSGCGWVLARHDCQLVISDNASPNTASSPTFLVGEEKRELLARSRLLLNVHSGDDPYFEWLRLAEAMHCGAAVLTEPAIESEPYQPGKHFLTAAGGSLAHAIAAALEDEPLLADVRGTAYETLRSHPMARTLDTLVGAAEDLRAAPVPQRVPARTCEQPYPHPARSTTRLDTTSDNAVIRQSLRELRLDLQQLRRDVAALQPAMAPVSASPAASSYTRAEPPPENVVATSAAWHTCEPEISVIIALFNQGEFVEAALDSVAANEERLEIVVVDDGSTDGSRSVVSAWLADHPWVPARVVAHPVNRGLPHARNTAVAFSRAPLVFVLDADNEVYPNCLARLRRALEEDPIAWFSFGMLERFDGDGPAGLIDIFPWEPWRLVPQNYIDAMAIIRRERLEQLSGYTSDRRLYGWEDYDLWCRVAEAGGHGAFVPNIVARYRVSPTSMISLSNVSEVPARSALRERCPKLFSGQLSELPGPARTSNGGAEVPVGPGGLTAVPGADR